MNGPIKHGKDQVVTSNVPPDVQLNLAVLNLDEGVWGALSVSLQQYQQHNPLCPVWTTYPQVPQLRAVTSLLPPCVNTQPAVSSGPFSSRIELGGHQRRLLHGHTVTALCWQSDVVKVYPNAFFFNWLSWAQHKRLFSTSESIGPVQACENLPLPRCMYSKRSEPRKGQAMTINIVKLKEYTPSDIPWLWT